MRNDRLSLVALLALSAACQRGEVAARGAAADSASAPAASAPATAPGLLAYVTNEGSEELSVIDTRTDTVVASIAVGTRPRGVRLTTDGKTIFVALSGSPRCPPTMPDAECEKLKADKSKDGIAVVDAASRKVTRVLPGGSDPENFDISKDGATLFISNEDAGTASVVDIASGKIRSTVKVGREPEGVRVYPDGSTVWVTGETDHNVSVLDTKTGKVIATIEVGQRPRSLDFTPDGKRAYVSSEVDGTVWVLDVAKRQKIAVITMPKDSKPMAVLAAPDGKRVYVSNGRGGTVLGDRSRHGFGDGIGAGREAAVGYRPDAGRPAPLHRQRPLQRCDRGRHTGSYGDQEDSCWAASLGCGHRPGTVRLVAGRTPARRDDPCSRLGAGCRCVHSRRARRAAPPVVVEPGVQDRAGRVSRQPHRRRYGTDHPSSAPRRSRHRLSRGRCPSLARHMCPAALARHSSHAHRAV